MSQYGTFKEVPEAPVQRKTRIPAWLSAAVVVLAVACVVLVGLNSRFVSSSKLLEIDDDADSSDKPDTTGVDISHLMSILPDRIAKLIDTSVDPCFNFHDFACGHWETSHKIPAEKSSITFAFGNDMAQTMDNLRLLLDPDAGGDISKTPTQLTDYFAACNDLDHVNELGLSPLLPYVSAIDAIDSVSSLSSYIATLHQMGVDIFFSKTIMPDHEHPSINQLYIKDGGLGLSSEKYYIEAVDGLPSPEKDAFLRFMQKIAVLAGMGENDAADAVNDMWAIETELAIAVHQKNKKGHTPEMKRANFNILSTTYPHFDWAAYFAVFNTSVDVFQDGAPFLISRPVWLAAFDRIIAKYTLPTLKRYLLLKLVRSSSPLLPAPFLAAFLEYGHAISGRQALLPRWKKCAFSVRTTLPFLLSQTYVAAYVPEKTKRVATAMVDDIRLALGREMEMCGWMSNSTRAEAIKKLRQMDVEVAYPTDWEPYLETAVDIQKGDYFGNYVRATVWKSLRSWSYLFLPVDRRRWRHVPIVANAYYVSGTNSAFLPIGILQDPFYNLSFPAAYNFGAVGSIIAHEVTHGFDATGHRFDGTGLRRSWWDPHTLHSYMQRSHCFSDYYDSFELDGVHVNGMHTLGEDIADVGGAKTSYYAFLLAAELYSPHPPSENDRRLFWLAYASTRCGLMRKKEEILSLETSVHPPHEFRLLGTVTQLKEFARDFQCPVGSPMNPEKKCELW